LRVDGPRAIELQHKTRQVIERINASFGYRAVAELRFIQAPLAGARAHTKPRPFRRGPAAAAVDLANLVTVQDEALRAALARLQASIRRSAG
jgi:hypothetical protein